MTIDTPINCVSLNTSLDDTLEKVGLQTNNRDMEQLYTECVAHMELQSLKEYSNLRTDKDRAKYIIGLVKKEEYFSAFKCYTNKLYTGRDISNKERVILWADKLVGKLVDDNMPGLIPVYVTIMYQIGRLKNSALVDRVKGILERKGFDSAKINEFLGWEPIFKSFL